MEMTEHRSPTALTLKRFETRLFLPESYIKAWLKNSFR
ncbi:Unknown protein sequence [Pseudomonas syringae pv. syringae]|nr:Unknown protein sequence [Pseudomonas syringae pv. syringae]